MLRSPVQAKAVMETVTAIAEGDGPGAAEPYLWMVFFKIDGDTVRVGQGATLEGAAYYERRRASQGNLWGEDPMAGDTVNVPGDVGWFATTLKPIPAHPSVQPLLREMSKTPDFEGWDDVPGIMGFAFVLMEEDILSNEAALAGYEAFASTFQTELDAILPTIRKPPRTPEEIAALVDPIKQAVKDSVKKAIRNHLDVITTAAAWLAGPDQTLASGAFFFSQDDLRDKGWRIAFYERNKEGTSVVNPFEDGLGAFFEAGPGSIISSGGEWELRGYGSGEEIVPPRTFRVECVQKGMLPDGRPSAIRTLGVRPEAGGELEMMPREQVMYMLERGDRFFTEVEGRRAFVWIHEPLDTEPQSYRHLTTTSDGWPGNNLLSMPSC